MSSWVEASPIMFQAESHEQGEIAMKSLIKRFADDESGATAIEYGLIAALIAVVCIGTLGTVGSKLNTKFTSISNGLN
jgi:pilus assembly protein Flp/PilA